MSADAHSTIAGRELLGIIQELEAEEEAIRDHNKVKSDIIKEAGGKGWDKKTIRKVMAARRLDPLERDEQDNLFDMYMQAVEVAEKASVHARVENAGKFGAAKPVEPTQEQPVTTDQSDGDAFVAVKGSARSLTNAAGVEPSPSVSVPHSSEPTSSPVQMNAGEVPPPASPAPISKPHCLKLKDGHCRIGSNTSALCSDCNNARMKARAA